MFQNLREAIAALTARPHSLDLHCIIEIVVVVAVALVADAEDVRTFIKEVVK